MPKSRVPYIFQHSCGSSKCVWLGLCINRDNKLVAYMISSVLTVNYN